MNYKQVFKILGGTAVGVSTLFLISCAALVVIPREVVGFGSYFFRGAN
jgi:hypothetical protein